MNEHEYDGIEYHEGHAACNVKVYGHIDVEPHEKFAQQAWDNTIINFWEQATELAHESGYSCVFAQGRSGGWLVPYRQQGMNLLLKSRYRISPISNAPLFWYSAGQGGSLGYPQYPDMDDIGERSRFRAFAKRIEAMMQAVPQMIKDEAVFLAQEAVESFA